MKNSHPELKKSPLVEEIPAACSDELTAVELLERLRWGNTPACVHCGSVSVYKMVDAKTGQRNTRYLWRCHDCGKQYTVRIGTVYEESRIPLKHWCYAFWRAATSKKGVAALELKRHCQISYKSALFMINRIRFAMAPERASRPKLKGLVELDETYLGGKPRFPGKNPRGRATQKTPVFCAVERGGQIRRHVVPDVTAATLREAVRAEVDTSAYLFTDEYAAYNRIAQGYAGHQSVCHSTKEYARGACHVNTAESSFALIKRGIHGIHHSVSREYLHRYLWHFDFLWNNRKLNDGERTALLVRAAEGRRLMYKEPSTQAV